MHHFMHSYEALVRETVTEAKNVNGSYISDLRSHVISKRGKKRLLSILNFVLRVTYCFFTSCCLAENHLS